MPNPDPPADSAFSFRSRGEPQAPVQVSVALAAGTTLGDFKLLRPIGEGGMGQVWEAEQLSLRRRVAVKLVRPDRVTKKTLDLFAREARAGGRLNHPGIVAVHGHGEDDGVAWIAMELIEGGFTLRDFLDDVGKRGALPERYHEEVAAFVAQLADALHAAHGMGVIHRDIKPRNVLISPDDRPKATDFGLARITDEARLSVTGEFAGTYCYMSPEQVAARRMGLDHRTDVFSLGVVLYEMLALRRPFDGDTTHQIAHQILQKNPPELRNLRSRIPHDLSVICGKCLEKDRDHRYASMADLAEDLRRFLAHEPIVARPPGPLRRVQLWGRRNPGKAAALILALLSFSVISWLLALNVRANRDLAASVQTERARAEEVLRLSALENYDDLVERAARLWPPYPARIRPYEEWLVEAREFLALATDPRRLEQHAELTALALPRTDEEVWRDRRAHPRAESWVSLRAEVESKRRALHQRRDGTGTEAAQVDWIDLPLDAAGLTEAALERVDPERVVFGAEPAGLAIVERALEVARASDDSVRVAEAERVRAYALFSLGLDDEALDAGFAALEGAPEPRLAEFEGSLGDLELRIEAAAANGEGELERLEAQLSDLVQEIDAQRRTWTFPRTAQGQQAAWWHANLSKLIEAGRELSDPARGLLSDSADAVSEAHGWSVPRRLAFAVGLRDEQARDGEWGRHWAQATRAIRESEHYGGLELAAQTGLVPLGEDPLSGLHEFAHLSSGTPAARDDQGQVAIGAQTGLVLVLIPGGQFRIGAQAEDPAAAHYDPAAESIEGPPRFIEVEPFFISKFELTLGQWMRQMARDTNRYPGADDPRRSLHPVEQVHYLDCQRVCSRLGLSLPTESQWERACRAGTATVWHTGDDLLSLAGYANLADRSLALNGVPASWAVELEFTDGFVAHAPVGSLAANPFGLHDVHGNVWEWCKNDFWNYDGSAPSEEERGLKVHRGGCWASVGSEARSSNRYLNSTGFQRYDLGLRPARAIEAAPDHSD